MTKGSVSMGMGNTAITCKERNKFLSSVTLRTCDTAISAPECCSLKAKAKAKARFRNHAVMVRFHSAAYFYRCMGIRSCTIIYLKSKV